MSGIERIGSLRPGALVDIVFVHGLGGHWKKTWEYAWQPETKPKSGRWTESRIHTTSAESATAVEPRGLFWPEWLAEAVPTAAVWALDYEASRSDWSPGMTLSQHGEQALAILMANDFGKRPIVFVAHSLGGLVVKSLLQTSYDDLSAAKQNIAQVTRGVVLFSTPNSGSRLATRITWFAGILGPAGQLARLSELVRVLRAGEPELLKLNRWYRDRVTDTTSKGLKILTEVFYETRPLALGLISIVDASSADPGIGGVHPIPIAEDHFAICKLPQPNHWVFKTVVDFISACAQTDARSTAGPIIELVVPPNAKSIRLEIDDNMIPSGNLTLRVTRSDGEKK